MEQKLVLSSNPCLDTYIQQYNVASPEEFTKKLLIYWKVCLKSLNKFQRNIFKIIKETFGEIPYYHL